jgi:hypothetical protein
LCRAGQGKAGQAGQGVEPLIGTSEAKRRYTSHWIRSINSHARSATHTKEPMTPAEMTAMGHRSLSRRHQSANSLYIAVLELDIVMLRFPKLFARVLDHGL